MTPLTKHFFLALVLLAASPAFTQQPTPRLYDPKADAAADIGKSVSRAAAEGKHVLLQIGGNWCSWCIKFDKLIHSDGRIDSLLRAEYVIMHVNYSKENTNDAVMQQLGYPDRFGFPVFVILDQHGSRLHTQDSGLLESGDHHDPAKVMAFLRNWTAKAVEGPRKDKK